MPTRSEKTVRVRNISTSLTDEQFKENFNSLLTTENKLKSHRTLKNLLKSHKASAPLYHPIRQSFVVQNQNGIATLSFQSADTKEKVLQRLKATDGTESSDWVADDVFDGITILSSPAEYDVE